jgi:hypothetical protein
MRAGSGGSLSMTPFVRSVLALLAALALAAPPAPGGELPAAVRAQALKVVKALDRIQAESLSSKNQALRRSDFSEGELNAYAAFRIEEEKEDVLKELKLKLFGENRVEGMAVVDLRRQNLPSFIKPRMSLYFEGVLDVRDGKARFDFRKLFLEGQEVPLLVLDVVLDIAARMGKTDAASVRAWVDLPYGIRDLKTREGGIALFY